MYQISVKAHVSITKTRFYSQGDVLSRSMYFKYRLYVKIHTEYLKWLLWNITLGFLKWSFALLLYIMVIKTDFIMNKSQISKNKLQIQYQNTLAFFWIRILHSAKLGIRFNLKCQKQYDWYEFKQIMCVEHSTDKVLIVLQQLHHSKTLIHIFKIIYENTVPSITTMKHFNLVIVKRCCNMKSLHA